MASLDELKKMLDQAPCGIGLFQYDGNGESSYLNEAYYQLIGYTREEYAALNKSPIEVLAHPDDLPKIQNQIGQLKRTGKIETEYRIVQKNGQIRWIKLNGTKIYVEHQFVTQDDAGEYLMLSIINDITEKKNAADILERERSRYRLALEQTHATIFEYDWQTGSFYCSESYHKYEMSRCDNMAILQNKGLMDCVHPDDLPVLQKFFSGSGQEDVEHECILRLKMVDGSYRWNRISGQQTSGKDGKPLRAIGVIMDINEELEKSLMMNELLSMLPGGVGIFKFTPKIQCLYFNQALLKLEGYSDAQMQTAFDAPDFVDKVIFQQDKELYQTEVLEKVRTGEKINCNFRYNKGGVADGNEIGWIHLSAVKMREEDGWPVYYAILAEPSNESKIFKQISERSLVSELALEYPSGKILYFNRAFRTLSKLPIDISVIGRGCDSILHAADADILKKFMRDSYAQAISETATWVSCGKYLKLQGHPMGWNGKDAFMMYISDQTETKQLNDKLERLINSVPSGIGMYEIQNEKLVQIYLNDAFYAMLHDTRENRQQYAGSNYLNAIHPDDVPSFRAAIERVLHGDTVVEMTYRVINGRGEWVWFRISGKLEYECDKRKILYCSFFDVDELVKTQHALEREQTILKLAMQTAKMSTWEYDFRKKCDYQSRGYQIQNGYADKLCGEPESMIDKGLIHPDSVDDFRKMLLPAVSANDVKQADLYVKAAENLEYCWQRVIIIPIFDKTGKHIRSIGTAIDVTEQKNDEQKYRRQIQELSAIDESNLIAKGFYNLTKNRVESYHPNTPNAVNVSNSATYDYGFEGTAQLFFKDGEAQKFRELFDRQKLIKNYGNGETEFSIEYQRKAADGTIFWARTQGRLAVEPNSKDILCFIYTHDINEHKIAQETISTVIQLDYDYFAVLDLNTNSYVVYSSRGAGTKTVMPPLRSLDYQNSVREYAEKYLASEDVEHNIFDMSIENVRNQLQTQESFSCYANIKEIDGKMHKKKLQFSYIDRENQQVLITRIDVTDVYEQEQKRLTELQNAAQALQQANRVKTDFLARMSHDLRTPMNAVIGLTELAKDELDDPLAMEHYLTSIRSAGNFLLGLVNDCLDLEKISENKMVLNPMAHPYDVFRQNIRCIIDPLCKAKNIAFVFPEKATPYVAVVDSVRLEQIFINLLTNAVKFTQEGGTIEFFVNSTCTEPHMLSSVFTVRDNGIGMSKEFQQRMFEPFEQEANQVTPQSQGTGLGLSIVKNLVDMMGGSISVKSEKGQGTEFTVQLNLPIADQAEANRLQMHAVFGAELKGKRALLVEDHPLNTEIARKLMEKKGICVTCARDGREALRIFQLSGTYEFDVILMDIRMPVMNGLEAASAIRALNRDDANTVPIIAMTANAFEEDVRATKEAGMNEHISKPIEPDKLYQVLADLIGNSSRKSE